MWIITSKMNNEDASGWSVKDIDVLTNYPIGEIRIDLHGAGHASQTAATLRKLCDKIELIADGHKVIKYLSSEQIRALATIRDGFRPLIKTSTTTNVQTHVSIPIRLGLLPYDKKHILATKFFDSLTLRITKNSTNWGYFTGGVFCDIEILQYAGTDIAIGDTYVLKEQEIFNIAAGKSDINESIVTGEIYSGLMIYNSVVGGNEYLPISLELSEGAFVPIRTTIRKAMDAMEAYLDDQARLEITASGNITTNYLWLPLVPPLNTKEYTDMRYKQDRSGASTTCVAVAQKLIPITEFVGADVVAKKVIEKIPAIPIPPIEREVVKLQVAQAPAVKRKIYTLRA